MGTQDIAERLFARYLLRDSLGTRELADFQAAHPNAWASCVAQAQAYDEAIARASKGQPAVIL